MAEDKRKVKQKQSFQESDEQNVQEDEKAQKKECAVKLF